MTSQKRPKLCPVSNLLVYRAKGTTSRTESACPKLRSTGHQLEVYVRQIPVRDRVHFNSYVDLFHRLYFETDHHNCRNMYRFVVLA